MHIYTYIYTFMCHIESYRYTHTHLELYIFLHTHTYFIIVCILFLCISLPYMWVWHAHKYIIYFNIWALMWCVVSYTTYTVFRSMGSTFLEVIWIASQVCLICSICRPYVTWSSCLCMCNQSHKLVDPNVACAQAWKLARAAPSIDNGSVR